MMSEAARVTEGEWLVAVDDLARVANAVHRPALVIFLCGRAQRGEPREVAFEAVELGISGVLERYGEAKRPEVLLPFWHLQSAPFWEVLDADALPRRAGKDRPTRSGLISHHARGAVRANWWASLASFAPVVGERILTTVWPAESDRDTVAAALRFARPVGRNTQP